MGCMGVWMSEKSPRSIGANAVIIHKQGVYWYLVGAQDFALSDFRVQGWGLHHGYTKRNIT
jgi:hypothetical protein